VVPPFIIFSDDFDAWSDSIAWLFSHSSRRRQWFATVVALEILRCDLLSLSLSADVSFSCMMVVAESLVKLSAP
jgi:hypothetical protein